MGQVKKSIMGRGASQLGQEGGWGRRGRGHLLLVLCACWGAFSVQGQVVVCWGRSGGELGAEIKVIKR